jgi:hypothetical protein
MVKVKKILSTLEKYKGKVIKFLIFGAIVKFYISTLYRIGEEQSQRKQLETVISIYSLLILGIIMIHEFFACCIPNFLIENFKMLTNLTGKGLIFILISILFLNPLLGNQQVYSAYFLLSVGILSIIADLKFEKNEEKNLLKKEIKSHKISSIPLESERCESYNNKDAIMDINETKESKPVENNNPYDIPDDF